MPRKAWAFDLEDGEHTVELEWSLFSSNEKLWVDGDLHSDEDRFVLVSRYAFVLAGKSCEVTLNGILGGATLKVEGQPMPLRAAEVLLRPASAPIEAQKESLLRPMQGVAPADASQLLRADTGEELTTVSRASEEAEEGPLQVRSGNTSGFRV